MLKKIFFSVLFIPWVLFSAELVKNGVPSAEIVLDRNASKAAQFGAYELRWHVQKMTGAELPIVMTESSNPNTKIFVGANEASRKIGITKDSFKSQEYLVKVDGSKIYLLGCDRTDNGKVDYQNERTFPDCWKEIGTTYAIYDFLEKLGVRWYLPTELGIVFPSQKTLNIANMSVHRQPSFEMRDFCKERNFPADLCGDTVDSKSAPLNERESELWYLRTRNGGKRIVINHSLYQYYDLFWPQKKSFFAKGYEKSIYPPQMCYTNPELIAQIVKDARAFFDGKIRPNLAMGHAPVDYVSDVFTFFPMDNDSFCHCDNCQKLLLKEAVRGKGLFSNDRSSNYMFSVANQIAKEIKKSHPGKKLAVAAYSSFAYPPDNIRLEDNIMIMLCLQNRDVYNIPLRKNDDDILNAWKKEYPAMKKFVWNYFCFPSFFSVIRQTRLFPGFFAGHAGSCLKKYTDANITGMFVEPSPLDNKQKGILFDQLEGYIYGKIAWDNQLEPKKLFDEFFRLYYGPAEKPMKEFYTSVESIYCNPENYPSKFKEINDEISWKYLGTDSRMEKLGKLIAEAKKTATTPPFRQRVELFERGIWQYMLKGKQTAEKFEFDQPCMQQAAIPYLNNVEPGNPEKIDWKKASNLSLYGGLRGQVNALPLSVKVAHDAIWLYFYYHHEGKGINSKLKTDDNVWRNDEWESFFGKTRSIPYCQLGIDARGHFSGMSYHGIQNSVWNFPGKVVNKTSENIWDVYIAVKLSEIVDGGVKPGETLYFNLIRSRESKPLACWIPTFGGYHAPERFGELYIEPEK